MPLSAPHRVPAMPGPILRGGERGEIGLPSLTVSPNLVAVAGLWFGARPLVCGQLAFLVLPNVAIAIALRTSPCFGQAGGCNDLPGSDILVTAVVPEKRWPCPASPAVSSAMSAPQVAPCVVQRRLLQVRVARTAQRSVPRASTAKPGSPRRCRAVVELVSAAGRAVVALRVVRVQVAVPHLVFRPLEVQRNPLQFSSHRPSQKASSTLQHCSAMASLRLNSRRSPLVAPPAEHASPLYQQQRRRKSSSPARRIPSASRVSMNVNGRPSGAASPPALCPAALARSCVADQPVAPVWPCFCFAGRTATFTVLRSYLINSPFVRTVHQASSRTISAVTSGLMQ